MKAENEENYRENKGAQEETKRNKSKNGFKFGEFSWSILGLVPIFLSIGLILVEEFGSVETLLYIGIWGCAVGVCAEIGKRDEGRWKMEEGWLGN